jgi:predicted O-methyltransferase YrrM
MSRLSAFIRARLQTPKTKSTKTQSPPKPKSGVLKTRKVDPAVARAVAESDRWRSLKEQANGMMHRDVYAELYRIAFYGPDLDALEIGGAAGAGSIALALGMKESGKKSRVIVVEKMQGGSRQKFGNFETNLDIFNRNLRQYDVEKHICLFPDFLTLKNGNEIHQLISSREIGALVLDADGNLHRDFLLFWDRVIPSGKIVIDDYRDDPSKFSPTGGSKLVRAFRLANYLMSVGLFKTEQQIRSTLIGHKPHGVDISKLDFAKCEEIVAEVERYRREIVAQRTEAEKAESIRDAN